MMSHLGLLQAIQEQIRFARARFGTYDTIDFVVVLIGYALSGERTLKAFYERLLPFANPFMALFGRQDLPDRSTLSRFLASLDQASVEALRTLFLADLAARTPFPSPGGVSDRLGNRWWIMDIDGTKQAARQRALPHQRGLPAPHRRMTQVCAPGYTGRKRGEVVSTRTTVLQAFTHQWIGTYAGAGNGNYREELKRALQAITWYAMAHALPFSQIAIRLDGLYGNAAPLTDVLRTGLGVIVRSKDYTLLDRAEVRAVLARPPVEICTHPESGATRALYDRPDISLGGPEGPHVRLIVATHPATSALHKIGKKRDGVIYELFVTRLPAPAFSAKDVLDLYLHRGSFETVLADEDREQDPDRWCSHTLCGQEFWQIVNQWIWNLRMELGQHLSPAPMRTTEFAPATEPAPVNDPVPATEPAPVNDPVPATESVPASEPVFPIAYGPPYWARQSFTGGFPGSAFTPQPDGRLLCPANHPLYPQERRPERDGSYRLLYAARIGDCRTCELRAKCQESPLSSKPRRVSAVFWPVVSPEELSPVPLLAPPLPLLQPQDLLPTQPILMQDWPRCQIRRNWLQVVRSETVVVAMGTSPQHVPMTETTEHLITRTERAHWRLSWQERLARNARSSTAPLLTLTLYGLPATFAYAYGFALLEAA
jgi:hypothetical protein